MKVSRLADKTDEIIPKVLEAGAEVVEDKVRSNLQSVIGSGKSGQPAKPFLKPARSASKNACISAMKAKLDEEVENI